MVLEHKVQNSGLAGIEGKIKERGAKIPYATMDLSRVQGELRARRKASAEARKRRGCQY